VQLQSVQLERVECNTAPNPNSALFRCFEVCQHFKLCHAMRSKFLMQSGHLQSNHFRDHRQRSCSPIYFFSLLHSFFACLEDFTWRCATGGIRWMSPREDISVSDAIRFHNTVCTSTVADMIVARSCGIVNECGSLLCCRFVRLLSPYFSYILCIRESLKVDHIVSDSFVFE